MSGELGTILCWCRSNDCRKERRMSLALFVMKGVLDTAPDGRVRAASVKSLGQQITIEPPGHCGVSLPRRSLMRRRPQFAVERLGDQVVFVDLAEYFGHRGLRQSALDPERLDGALGAKPAVALHVRFGAGAGEGGPLVVERANRLEAGDGLVDRAGVELFPRQPGAHLRLRKLAAGEHPEGGDVGVHALIIV